MSSIGSSAPKARPNAAGGDYCRGQRRYACSGGGVVAAGRIGAAAGTLATDTGTTAVGVIIAADAAG